MPQRAAIVLSMMMAVLAAAAPAGAQTPATAPPDRPGPYVIDIRGVTIGAPQGAAFYPPVPAGTVIPTRAFGFDVGGHVYLFQFGPARVGVGANLLRFRGTASPATTTVAAAPDMKTTTTTLAPQVSFNFGSSEGWSYLSAGFGTAHVNTARSSFDKGEALTHESGSLSSVNLGAGARWFASATTRPQRRIRSRARSR